MCFNLLRKTEVSEWHKGDQKESFRLKAVKFSFVRLDSVPDYVPHVLYKNAR